jgi:hypothetical protein
VLEEEPLVDTGLAARLRNRTLELPHALEPYEPVLELVQLGLFVYLMPPLVAVAEFLGLVTC